MSRPRSKQNIFAKRLRDARKKRELTQSELARKAGMQPSAIGHFEREGGRSPSFSSVRALANALNVSSDYLMGLDGTTTAFRNEENLTDVDRDHIQMMIDLMYKKKQEK